MGEFEKRLDEAIKACTRDSYIALESIRNYEYFADEIVGKLIEEARQEFPMKRSDLELARNIDNIRVDDCVEWFEKWFGSE